MNRVYYRAEPSADAVAHSILLAMAFAVGAIPALWLFLLAWGLV